MAIMNLFYRFWNDDTGGIISTEYVMVMGIVVTGASAGLVKLRDEGNKQMADLAALPAATVPTQDDIRRQVAMPVGSASVVQNVNVNVFLTRDLPPSP